MRCNTTRQHFTSSKEMLNKNGVVPLTIMGLQHSNSRQEKHKQLKHMRLRFVTGRNVPSHTELSILGQTDLLVHPAIGTMELYVLEKQT